MQRIDDELVLSPTDLTKHLGCAHITTLDLLALEGNATPAATDDALQLIFDLGIAHEEAYLAYLHRKGLSITTIEQATKDVSRAQREVETLEAMRTGVDVTIRARFTTARGAVRLTSSCALRRPRTSARGRTRSRTRSSPGT